MAQLPLAALVLAAGQGSRLGGGKLALAWKEKPLLCHTLALVEKANCFSPCLCIVGHDAVALCEVCSTHSAGNWHLNPRNVQPAPFWNVHNNPLWQQGQSTSLKAGIQWLTDHNTSYPHEGVMVFLGDQPLVQTSTIHALVAAFTQQHAHHTRMVIPTLHGQRGNPVIISATLFPAIASIQGDRGARALLPHLQEHITFVPVTDKGILFDIDTPEAFARLIQQG